ncbi:glutamate--tRNA ligase [Candidatus Woesearchaeota archaeon]|nr:glutamate--tRNA ligase [Candidatus Woesearchaeota archaeon]
MADLQTIIRKYALQNAVMHNGKAHAGNVIGKVLAEDSSFKLKIDNVKAEVELIVKEVNSLPVKVQLKELQKRFPELLEKKEAPKKELKPLENTEHGVVMRFEPSPSGPLHIGHAYVLGLNYLYAQRYKGKLILRIADTNPGNIDPVSYELIPEDAQWLCDSNVHDVAVQSDRMQLYYDYAEKLLEQGHAYICICSQEEFKEYSKQKADCPCRIISIAENMKRWHKMHEEYHPGDAVMRLKTNMQHKNPAMRDFPLMRIHEDEHSRQGTKYHVWPLMNFSVSVDDVDMAVTHVLRGKDHADNAKRQEFIYKYLNHPIPQTLFVGRINFSGMEVSCSKTRPLIEAGTYTGWDDIRLPFLLALRRRGFKPGAFLKYAEEVGVTLNDKTVSKEEFFAAINAFNKEIVEPKAYRYFFIEDPVEVVIEGAPMQEEIELDLHPNNKKGGRWFRTHDKFYLAASDVETFKEGELYRLMDCLNFRKKGKKLVFDSLEYEKYKENGARIMHWLPAQKDLVEVEVVMDGYSVRKGLGEPGMKNIEVDQVVQLERFGFCRLDDDSVGKKVFWWTHK